MSESQTFNFTVNVTLNTKNEAVFTYFQDGQQVSGGGTVNERNSLGIYTLDDATVDAGFQFTGAKFANLEGNCEQDFSFKVTNNGQTIEIVDSDENNGTACMIFIVECNGTSYESADPQVENEKEN
ncbi:MULTISPECIES: DP-EP family protein [Pseudoalteromonas]|uniref:DP-EP family protein n=1 Tax=Pseudoalteromonas TaxID=53246 RepID=UPI000780F2DA|nr:MULTISPECIES: DP-EP family protein [Pseudoalteromonas]MCO7205934.1 DP-EP family protein [Pseudoalteromonas sp. CnMc7-37]